MKQVMLRDKMRTLIYIEAFLGSLDQQAASSVKHHVWLAR
jgi:hypothetical protein